MRGGVIMFVTRNTLTQIKGTRLEALFSGRWDKRLQRDEDGRVFLDVNPNCFGAVVDFLSKRKITLPDYSLKILCLGEEDDTVLQQLLVAFGLRDDGMDKSMKLLGKMNSGTADDGSNNHSKEPEEEWKVMKFDHLSKETPHDIKTALEEEQKALLAANNKLIEQRLLFEEENNDLIFFPGRG